MIFDILILAALVFVGYVGFKKGFVYNLIQTSGWVASIALAYLCTSPLNNLLKKHTTYFDIITDIVKAKFDISLEAIDVATSSLPEGLQPTIPTDSESLITNVATGFANVFSVLITFLLLFAVFKVCFWFIQKIFQRDYLGGYVGTADGVLGAVFGVIRGFLIITVALVILLTVSNLISTGFAEFVSKQIQHSFITKYLFNGNFIIMILQAFVH